MRKRILLILAFLLSVLTISNVLAADVILIANNSVPDASLDGGTVKNIFLGKKSKWSDNSKIVPAMLKSGPARDAFISNVISMSENQYQTFWNQAIFAGKGTPPKSFASDADILQFVASTPGAIGYVSTSSGTSGVKKINLQ